MRNFPAVCIDGFYSDPDAVRNFALEQDFCSSSPNWPGRRTKHLHEINPIFFEMFCRKLFSIYYDFTDITKNINWVVLTSFQLIPPFSKDENSPENIGWIHRDDSVYSKDNQGPIFAGIIYLTPGINKNSGTSIFKRVNFKFTKLNTVKQDYYGKGIDTGIAESIEEQSQEFEETIRYYNQYNRLVSFDATCFHGANSFYSSDLPRLTQVFFVLKIDSEQKYPLKRCEENNIL